MKYAEKISCSKKKERKYQLGKTAKVSTHCVAIWVHQLFPKCLEVGPQTTVLAALRARPISLAISQVYVILRQPKRPAIQQLGC